MKNDRAQIIKEARKAVKSAFRHDTIPGESPVAYFSGQHRPKQKKRKPGKVVRQVHATATRAPQFSKPNLIGRQELTGYIHRCIADLEPLEFLWLQFRYRPPGLARTNHAHNFMRDYFKAYEKDHLQGCKAGTRRMVRYLISVALENEVRPGQSVEPDGGDVDRRNWNKTYRPHWHRVCLGLSNIDSAALLKIGQKLNAGGDVA